MEKEIASITVKYTDGTIITVTQTEVKTFAAVVNSVAEWFRRIMDNAKN